MKQTAAMDNGLRVHKLGEDYVKGDIKKVPVEYVKFDKEMKLLRKNKAIAEEKWCFDSNWNLLDNYYHPRAWLRVTIDAHDVSNPRVRVVDYKTGKPWPGYEEQIELYDTSIFAVYNDVEISSGELWYLDYGVTKTMGSVSADEFPELKKLWYDRTRPMFRDKKFLPKQNTFCYNCEFNKKNGGDCNKG